MSDLLLDPEGRLLDWLVGFMLGTLDGQHVEIRVVPASSSRPVMMLSVSP